MRKITLASLMLVLAVCFAFGTAATAPVNTPSRSGMKSNYDVYTNTIIYAGSIVCLNSSGYAIAGADASGNIVVGRAAKTVDNRNNNPSGLASTSGAQTIDVERGVFGWAYSGTSFSDDTCVGAVAYVLDSQTLTNASAGNSVIAGIVVDYADSKVWVDTFNVPRTVGSFTTLAASGATTLSTSLAVGTSATVGTSLTVGTKISEYGYPVTVCHTNGSVQVYMTQIGTATANAGVTSTNTFPVSFIDTPVVLYTFTAGSGAYIPTNYPTISSNAFTLIAGTNFTYFAYGRIK